uniref:RNase H type-1 domain-containing protein n=1 Tax=Arion vulgaris TaxID=1028688 RepID=A0A0B6Y7B9_9EUPU
MNVIKKIQASGKRQDWIVTLSTSQMTHLIFIFIPWYAGVQGNEQADHLSETQW